MAHEPMRVGLTDLRETDKRGRWWLVGAAWAGDPLVEHQTSGTAAPKTEAKTKQDALLALARKHGMSTDMRRSIFVVLMSLEDCVDAAALGLNAVQQREVPRVALRCLGTQRAYNPFWALVVQKTLTPAQARSARRSLRASRARTAGASPKARARSPPYVPRCPPRLPHADNVRPTAINWSSSC